MPLSRAISRKLSFAWFKLHFWLQRGISKQKSENSASQKISNFSSNLSHKQIDKQIKNSKKSAFLNFHFCIYQFQLVPRELILNATERKIWEYDKISFLAYFANLKQYLFTWCSKFWFLTLNFASRRTKGFKSYTLVLDLSNSGQKDD